MTVNKNSLIILTDSYKCSHPDLYPKGMDFGMSHFISRGGLYPETLFFGLQAILKEFFLSPITMEDVEYYCPRIEAHGEPGNREAWERLVKKHGGKPPISVKAVKEGSLVKTGNALFTVETTDPEFAWLQSYFEGLFEHVWSSTTGCTRSFTWKRLIKKYLEETSDGRWQDEILFKVHDFGFRGCSSVQTARYNGCAHLVNFRGSDTMIANEQAKEYYGEDMASWSIGAFEHSVFQAHGRGKEKEALIQGIKRYLRKPGDMLAAVGDTWDMMNFTKNIACDPEVLALVKNSGGKLIVRPDSGSPSAMVPMVLRALADKAGHTVNSKGFTELPPYLGVIQGDGMDDIGVPELFYNIKLSGFSANTTNVGSGGGLHQAMTRDTNKFAYKLCATRDSQGYKFESKDPITDPGKRSKCGILDLIINDAGVYETIDRHTDNRTNPSELQEVYRNGELLVDQTLAEIRARADSYL